LTASTVPPLATGFATLVALIPATVVTGGLYAVGMRIAQERRVSFADFWHSIAQHYLLSLKLGATILITGIILLVDVLFYLNTGITALTILGLVGLWGLLLWIAVQIYLFPMAFLLEEPRLTVILKNSGALTLAYPFFALGILVTAALATAVSVLLLLILLATAWMPFIAVLSSRATLSSLDEVKRAQAQSAQRRKESDEAEDGHRSRSEQSPEQTRRTEE
jgi:uncharacterized membrane protein YesL